jgi:hypothetical protein
MTLIPFWSVDVSRFGPEKLLDCVLRVSLWYVCSKITDAADDGKMPVARECG